MSSCDRFMVCVALAVCFSCASAWAVTHTPKKKLKEKKQQLSQVSRTIVRTQQALKMYAYQALVFQKSLRRVESALSVQNQQLQRLNKKSRLLKRRCVQMTQRYQQAEHKGSKVTQALMQQVQSTYRYLRQPRIKICLGEGSVQQVLRMEHYYRAIAEQTTHLIQRYHQNALQTKRARSNVQLVQRHLSSVERKMSHHSKMLHADEQVRQQLLNSNRQHIAHGQSQLQRLRHDKGQLAALVIKLAAQVKAQEGRAFAVRQHHLPWPTAGKLQALYGTPVDRSQLKWEGDLILAPAGTPVYAVAPGTVVFSQWLSGYGLLVIVSHGQGYFTLYGRNQSIASTVKVGSPVAAGAVLAYIGNTGGYRDDALYFAIRHKNKALNPSQWCSKRV